MVGVLWMMGQGNPETQVGYGMRHFCGVARGRSIDGGTVGWQSQYWLLELCLL